jgi:hypothetical protein
MHAGRTDGNSIDSGCGSAIALPILGINQSTIPAMKNRSLLVGARDRLVGRQVLDPVRL